MAAYRITVLLDNNREIAIVTSAPDDDAVHEAVGSLVADLGKARDDGDGWIVLGERTRVRADRIVAAWWDEDDGRKLGDSLG